LSSSSTALTSDKAEPEKPGSLLDLIKEPIIIESNNPYHVATKKEKLKVLSSKITKRLSVKVKGMFDKKKGEPIIPADISETATSNGGLEAPSGI
jgi:hypothetical protein